MPDFRAPLKTNQNAILAAVLDPVTADPSTPIDGQVWYRTDLDVFKWRINGVTREFRRTDVQIVNADLASGIDFAKLNAPVAAFAFGNQRLTSLGEPTAASDAATRSYVDSRVGDIKASVRAATTANVTLAGGAPNTLDGVTLAANDRVLVKNQSTSSQNGIYTVQTLGSGSNGTWVRAADADETGDLTLGSLIYVEAGTTHIATWFYIAETTNADGKTITIGTDTPGFVATNHVERGVAALPSYTFAPDRDTGMYSPGADQVAFAAGGAQSMRIATDAVYLPNGIELLTGDGSPANPPHGFTSDPDTGMYLAGDGLLGFAVAGTQRARLTASELVLNSIKISGLPSTPPSADTDAASKGYVDSVAQGLDAKASVRVATTAALAVTGRTATTLTIGGTTLSIDGVALANGDRVLVKDSTTGTGAGTHDNGIYTVGGIGSSVVLTRATDSDTWGELVSAFTFVEQGTVNADNGYVSTVDGGGTLGTTAVTFVQFSGAGQITAGAGLTKNGNTIDVGQGTGISVAADAIAIDSVVVPRKHMATITGNGSATSFTVTHNFNNQFPAITVYRNDANPYVVEVDITDAGVNSFIVRFGTAPANGEAYVATAVG